MRFCPPPLFLPPPLWRSLGKFESIFHKNICSSKNSSCQNSLCMSDTLTNLVVSNLVVCNVDAEALFCTLLRPFLRTTAFRTTAFGNFRSFPYQFRGKPEIRALYQAIEIARPETIPNFSPEQEIAPRV